LTLEWAALPRVYGVYDRARLDRDYKLNGCLHRKRCQAELVRQK
jgi:hypothetical protein